MDHRLKQRLIGAAVVVALAVIIVPELVKRSAGPEQPAVTTHVPPRPVQESPSEDVVISLPSEAAPASEEKAPLPAEPAPEDNPPAPPLPPSQQEKQAAPEAKRFATEPAEKPEDTVVKPEKTADREAGKSEAAKPGKEETVKTTTAAKPKVAKERETKAVQAKPTGSPKPAAAEAAKEEENKAAAKPTHLAKVDKPKPEKEVTAKPVPATKATDIALPKIELVGKSTASSPEAKAAPERTARVDTPSAAPTAKAGSPEPSGWMVQAGSFALAENANLLRDKLRGQRFNAFVEPIAVGGRTLYRVRIGPQSSKAESEALLARLQREAGVSGQIVPRHD